MTIAGSHDQAARRAADAQPPDDDDAAHPSPSVGMREAVRYIAELHGAIRRPVIGIVAVGATSGLVEAVALIAFVRAAIAITTDDAGDPSVGGVTLSLSPGALLIAAMVLATIAALLHVLLARASARLGERVAVNSRTRLIRAFLDAQWAYVARYRDGQLQEAMSGLTSNASRATTNLAVGISSVVIIAALGIAAIIASPLVSTILMFVPVVIFLVARPRLGRLRGQASTNVSGQFGLSAATSVTANLAMEYRTTGTQRAQADRLAQIAAHHSAAVARARTALFTMAFLFKDSALIALIGVVGALYLVTDLRAAAVTAAILLVIRMLGYLQQAFRLVQESVEDFATIEALRDTIDELESHQEVDGHLAVAGIDEIEFTDVRYAYATSGVAIDGVSFSIEANTTVGLIGPSGAGKSTLAELLLGLRTPDAGHVRVNGVDLTDLRRADWTRLTALVPQHQQLAPVTVRENIAFLRDWIDDDAVVAAAERAHVRAEIEQLPGGYDHVLGSRTQGLSGGQRQRIAIARALAGNPQLLVLDEPTSALDAGTEELFRQTLEELHGQITIVVIAHRPATLRACDRVVELRDGRIEHVGDGPRLSSDETLSPPPSAR
jgi:ABC-type multidrug transport system fused ATPase/permease subunit